MFNFVSDGGQTSDNQWQTRNWLDHYSVCLVSVYWHRCTEQTLYFNWESMFWNCNGMGWGCLSAAGARHMKVSHFLRETVSAIWLSLLGTWLALNWILYIKATSNKGLTNYMTCSDLVDCLFKIWTNIMSLKSTSFFLLCRRLPYTINDKTIGTNSSKVIYVSREISLLTYYSGYWRNIHWSWK